MPKWRNLLHGWACNEGLLNVAMAEHWKWEVAPSRLASKHSNIFHNVSLCFSGLTTIALHLPSTSPMELNQ